MKAYCLSVILCTISDRLPLFTMYEKPHQENALCPQDILGWLKVL